MMLSIVLWDRQPHEVALKRDPTDDRPSSAIGRAEL